MAVQLDAIGMALARRGEPFEAVDGIAQALQQRLDHIGRAVRDEPQAAALAQIVEAGIERRRPAMDDDHPVGDRLDLLEDVGGDASPSRSARGA